MDTASDARNRAWRTCVQGLLIDVVAAVVMAIAPALLGADFAFTGEYWAAVGVLAAKTAVASVVSYVARKVVPPPA